MSIHAEIKATLREIMGESFNQPIQCEVKSIEGNSCTVRFADMDVPKVRLRATLIDSDDQLLITPKKGSKVTVLSITGELDDLAIIKVDQVEKIEFKQGSLTFVVDATEGKVKIENGNVSLKTLMQDLHDIIMNLKVNTPSGPSAGLLPDSVTALTQFSTKFQQLLN